MPYTNAAYTFTFMADDNYEELEISSSDMPGLREISAGIWE